MSDWTTSSQILTSFSAIPAGRQYFPSDLGWLPPPDINVFLLSVNIFFCSCHSYLQSLCILSSYFFQHTWLLQTLSSSAHLSMSISCVLSPEMYPVNKHHMSISYTRALLNRVLPWNFLKNSKWVWSGNTTITNCRQPHGTARKSRSTIMRHQEDKLSKAISSLFPIKMIAILEWT